MENAANSREIATFKIIFSNHFYIFSHIDKEEEGKQKAFRREEDKRRRMKEVNIGGKEEKKNLPNTIAVTFKPIM